MKLIFIDPGHGGTDPGAGGHGLAEKDLTLNLARKVRDYLHRHYDCDARLSRSQDKTVSLAQRTNMANGLKAACLVSIHINAASDSRANGFESLVYTTDGAGSKSVTLQNHLHRFIAPLWIDKGRRDRGKKKANLHMVREFRGTSVLLELGFISNADDARLLKDDAFLLQNAAAIAEGIAHHLELTEKDELPVYRVRVDGEQTGAYSEPDNIVQAVQRALADDANNIEIIKRE